MGQMKYPCNECIVLACCSIYCENWFLFINKMADEVPSMTADEIYKLITITPKIVREVVEYFMKSDSRYAYAYINNSKQTTRVDLVDKHNIRVIGTGSV